MKLATFPMIIPHGTNRLITNSSGTPFSDLLPLNQTWVDSDPQTAPQAEVDREKVQRFREPAITAQRPQKISRRLKSSPKIQCLVLLLAILGLPGCGQKTYEERLQQTAQLYEYLNGVEESLSAPWSRPELGLSMRLPKPIAAPLPGPTRTRDKNGNLIVGDDPREENILRAKLPGIVEAWQASVDSPDGQPNVWIYLLTNQDRFLSSDQGSGKPEEFLTDLEKELMRVLQVTVPEGVVSKVGENTRYRQWIPAQNSPRAAYTTPKDYTVIRFAPEKGSRFEDWQVSLYERRAGKVQAALLVIAPKNSGPAFRQRLDQSLETLDVKEVMPRSRINASGGGTATQASPRRSADF